MYLVLVVEVELVAVVVVAESLFAGVVQGLDRFSTVTLVPKSANLIVCAFAQEPVPTD